MNYPINSRGRFLVLVVIIFIITFVSLLLLIVSRQTKQGHLDNDISDFNVLSIDSIILSKSEILVENSISIIVYFDSNCDICHMVIEDLIQNSKKVENLPIILISANNIEEIKGVRSTYNLDNYFFDIYKDLDYTASKALCVENIPNIFVVENSERVIFSYQGAVSTNRILNDICKYEKHK